MMKPPRTTALVLLLGLSVPTAAQAPARSAAATIPLCPGLTVVTAVNQEDGDYESIKTIMAADANAVRLKYSVEREVVDLLLDTKKFERFTLYRSVRRADLDTATLYEQQFATILPETIPQTTAIGTSAAVLNALKTKGEAQMGIFIPYSQDTETIDRNQHPNVYDNQMLAKLTRVSATPVDIPVIVNDVPTKLPTIQATGDYFGDKSEFFFLDDPANPIALRFRIGIGGIQAMDATRAKAFGVKPHGPQDKDVLQVVKINYACAAPPQHPAGGGGAAGAGAGGGALSGAARLEQELAKAGRADIYSIYFSFNSDTIRSESEPTLNDIAEVLRRHPDWRLAVNGHTDGIGGDQYNLQLSARRSAAVKDALVKRYGVAPARLTTAGFGKSQPKDTNATLEGRARNRRVELVRL